MSEAIESFDTGPEAEVRAQLHACLAVPRWIDDLLAGRPYGSPGAALAAAGRLARTLTPPEVEAALARHPRIGEKAGAGHDAAFSTREQSGLAGAEDALTRAIRAGNLAYEAKFGRVFLIRAAGRTPAEVLAELNRRLANDEAAELPEVVEQLAQIAERRLAEVLGGSA